MYTLQMWIGQGCIKVNVMLEVMGAAWIWRWGYYDQGGGTWIYLVTFRKPCASNQPGCGYIPTWQCPACSLLIWWWNTEIRILLVCLHSEVYSILNSLQFHLLFGWCFWSMKHLGQLPQSFNKMSALRYLSQSL